MGSSSSRPTMYPFPMPENDRPLPSKSGKWSLSIKKKSKKGRDHEKLDDFIIPKYTTPTATYGLPYYPQMQSAFPAYYAPAQMAFVQPFGFQQPVLAMPQAYVPMLAAAPTVQPPVTSAPVIQPAPAVQMPVPAVQPAPAMQMPAPAPASVAPPAPPPTAPTQMPQPHPPSNYGPAFSRAPTQMPQSHPPSNYGPVLPPSPVPAQPVIPPPPIVNSEPPRTTPDSGRIRFTDFYRPADLPPLRRPSIDSPVRPPRARTPFSAPMPMPVPSSTPAPMPMPMPASAPSAIPRSNNPLPPPPMDIWDTSPYRHVLANLPADLPDLLDLQRDMLAGDPEPVSRPPSRLSGLLGSRDKGKKPLRGLFRARSTSGQSDVGVGSSSRSRHGHTRAQTLTTIVIPPPGAGANRTSTMGMPVPTAGPPVTFDHTGDYAGFVNHSRHRVMFKNKMYPTALHLLEAMKFTHQPALQERIRTCKDVNDMYPLSASFQEHVRPDWGQAFLNTMEEVLYLKFKQHPDLRGLLLRTGLANIIYTDENTYWGDGPLGDGANELGKALVRLRERLRQEGEN